MKESHSERTSDPEGPPNRIEVGSVERRVKQRGAGRFDRLGDGLEVWRAGFRLTPARLESGTRGCARLRLRLRLNAGYIDGYTGKSSLEK